MSFLPPFLRVPCSECGRGIFTGFLGDRVVRHSDPIETGFWNEGGEREPRRGGEGILENDDVSDGASETEEEGEHLHRHAHPPAWKTATGHGQRRATAAKRGERIGWCGYSES